MSSIFAVTLSLSLAMVPTLQTPDPADDLQKLQEIEAAPEGLTKDISLSYIYLKVRSLGLAEKYGKQAESQDSKSVTIKTYLGDVQYWRGKFEAAIEKYQEAQRLADTPDLKSYLETRIESARREIDYKIHIRSSKTLAIVLGFLTVLFLCLSPWLLVKRIK